MTGPAATDGPSLDSGGCDTKKVYVPGSEAPSVSVPGLWNSFGRHLSRHGGSLASFFQCMCSNRPRPRDDGSPGAVVWPIPLPYPEIFCGRGCGRDLWKRRRLCLQIVVLNWLWLGKPRVAPFSIAIGQKLTSRQWRTVRLLEHLAEDGNSLTRVDAADMGRVASKTEGSAYELRALHRAAAVLTGGGKNYVAQGFCPSSRIQTESDESFNFGSVGEEIEGANMISAKPIVAERLTFVGSPNFDPSRLFDTDTLKIYEDPLAYAKHPDVCEEPPKVKILANPEERLKLLKKLAASGRLQIFTGDEVNPRYAAGLFAVVKDLERDRLILDARPANIREVAPSTWTSTLASAASLASIELEEDKVLLCSGQDLRDFFYQFRVTRARAARNVLCGSLSKKELEDIFGELPHFTADHGFVGLNTLAVGDLCACEFAQGSHVQLLLEAGVLEVAEMVQHRSPFPRGLLGIGIVIDDLVALEQVLKSEYLAPGFSHGKTEVGGSRMPAALRAYEAAGLLTNQKKAFDSAACASFWGCEIDGMKGLLRSSSTRFWPLYLITPRTACLGLATCGLLSSLAGSWISVFLVRRRLMSGMNLIFDAVSHCSTDRQVVRLSPGLIDELFSFCLLGSLCVVNLRASTRDCLKATDASDWGMAAVEASLPRGVCRELCRHSLVKSCWSQMLPPSKAWMRAKGTLPPEEELPGGDVLDVHPLWETLARGLRYEELWRKEHRKPVHINIAELRAHLREEARMGANVCSVRQLYGLDSQVALGGLVKGRCSSKALNSELSRSIPVHLGCDLYGSYLYFPSSANRADGPTRGVAPAAPDVAMPKWWDGLVAGDLGQFDEWMGAQRDMLRRVQEPQLLPQPLEGVDLRSGREVKAEGLEAPAAESGEPVGAPSPVSELCEEAVAILESFHPRQFLWKDGESGFLRAGAIDLYTGRGGVSRALIRRGCPWVLTVDWERSSEEDLLQPSLQEKIIRLVELGAVRLSGSALICASFSKAVTPAVRSPRYVRGLPRISKRMRVKVKQGNVHADFNKVLIAAVEGVGAHFWLENPDSSYLWKMRGYQRFSDPGSTWCCRLDFCRFKTRWRKRTRIGTSLPRLRGLRLMCSGGHEHLVLRGMSRHHRKPWTAVAEPYPRGLCELIAVAACDACGWRRSKLDVAGCARTGSLKAGEAQNPGPRRARVGREGCLADVPIQGAATLALGRREWEKFIQWSRGFLSQEPVDVFLRVPLFLVHALRHFGDLQYQVGSSLSYFRHLILEAQRQVPSSRQYMSVAWDYATRWRNLEPTVHRQPLPHLLMKAMVSLAWLLDWKRWAGVTLLAYFGIGRLGEVIRCNRKQLLLPRDVFDTEIKDAYLVLYTSKTMHRQPARVQHMKVTDGYVVRLLTAVFFDFEDDSMLYYAGAGAYRKRWDMLLGVLGVPASLSLTPGGLRGGGAIHAYRSNVDLPSLMWRMRIRHQATLESYLQETAALSALTSLPDPSLLRIRAASEFFPYLEAACNFVPGLQQRT